MRNAAGAGHIQIVKLLLEHGADPNLLEEGIAPRGHGLYAAVSNGHYDIAKLLLEHGAYPMYRDGGVRAADHAVVTAYNRACREVACGEAALLADFEAAVPVSLIGIDGVASDRRGLRANSRCAVDAVEGRVRNQTLSAVSRSRAAAAGAVRFEHDDISPMQRHVA
jgi:hypothetical protein